MTTYSFKRLAEQLEVWLFGLLLLFFLGAQTPSIIVAVMKPASYGLLAVLISLRWKKIVYVATRDIPLMLLIGLTVASVFWSAAPEFTSDEVKAVIRSTLFGVYLAARYSTKEQIRLLGWVFGIAALLSLALTLVVPAYGTHGGSLSSSWRGIFNYKNNMAGLMSMAAMLFLLIAIDRSRQRLIALAGFSLTVALVVLSQGKTSYAVFGILLCLLPIYKFIKQQYKLRVILLLIGLLLSGSAAVLILNNLEFVVVETLGKTLEFNGRMPIWTLVLDKVFERPWFGYGFAGFWTSDNALYVINNTWARGGEVSRFNAHSGYLDLILQLGFIGFSVYIIGFITLLTRLLYLSFLNPTIEKFWMFQILVAFFLLNLADAFSILGTGTLWTIYVAITLSTAIEQTRIRKKRQLQKLEQQLIT